MNPEQIALRKTGLGATDVAGIVGLSDYATPFTVYADKKGLRETIEETDQMRFGKRIERVVADIYADRYRREIEWLDTTFRHPDPAKAYALATPDFRHKDALKQGGEAKSSAYRDSEKWGEEGTDRVPEGYFVQVQWQMHVMEWDVVMMPVWFARNLVTYVIPRNDAVIEQLDKAAAQYWDAYVVGEAAPELDWTEAAKAWTLRQFPEVGQEIVEATPGQIKMLRRYNEVSKQEKTLVREKEALKNQIRAAIGHNRGIAGDGCKAVSFTVKGYERLIKVGPHRQTRVLVKGEAAEEE